LTKKDILYNNWQGYGEYVLASWEEQGNAFNGEKFIVQTRQIGCDKFSTNGLACNRAVSISCEKALH
jgi:hypothetical protein